MKTLVAVNTLTEVAQEVYASHCCFWSSTKSDFPAPDQFFFYCPRRTSIDRMRNGAADLALELGVDYLMFIDDDVIVRPNTFKSLLSCNLDIVMAHTYIRGYPFHPMCFKYRMKDGNQFAMTYFDEIMEEVKDGVALCDAVGFSCVLIKMDIIRKVTKPYFVTMAGSHTEDIYFCVKARRELGQEVSIGVDTRVPTSHLFNRFFVGEDNVKFLREISEKENPEIVDATKRAEDPLKREDYPSDYIQKCLEAYDNAGADPQESIKVVGFSDVQDGPRVKT